MMISAPRYDYVNLIKNNMELICIHEELEHSIKECTGDSFLQLVEEYISNGGNPDLTFSGFDIGDRSFQNVTFFQVIYLYWKDPLENWSRGINLRFERAIDQMLEDARTNLRAKFTETFLEYGEHFLNINAGLDASKQKGYLLERTTIAHYAMAIGDFEMVDKILRQAPDLVHSMCCLTKGKNLLAEEVVSVISFIGDQREVIEWSDKRFSGALEKIRALDNDEVAGEIARVAGDLEEEVIYPVTRITQVSLLHLAARRGNELACGYFRGFKANFVARDSNELTPFDYLKLSLTERFVEESSTTKRLLKVLEPIVRLNKPILPETSLTLVREGYWAKYDTRTRVSYTYERLTRQSLVKNAQRTDGGSFRIDREVPPLNRGTSSDYTGSGSDRAHLAPAGDNVSSKKAMQDTFLYSNICPQNPELNRGYWKHLESAIRDLTYTHDLIEVVTGCLFLADHNVVNYQTIGQGQISVPTHFFKVLYRYAGLYKATDAYIFPNAPIAAGTPYGQFEVSVDRVQQQSGILFNQWRP